MALVASTIGRGVARGVGRGRLADIGPVREGNAAVAQTRPAGRVVGDDQMVEQLDVEQPTGGERLGGQVHVVRRRRRVAARVVVGDDDAGGVHANGEPEKLADAHERGGDVAGVDDLGRDDRVLRAQREDRQSLGLALAEHRLQGGEGVLWRSDAGGQLGDAMPGRAVLIDGREAVERRPGRAGPGVDDAGAIAHRSSSPTGLRPRSAMASGFRWHALQNHE